MQNTNKKSRILIVDDIPENIDVLGNILAEDHDVVVATSGMDALALVKKSKPDLILLDVMMPEMDGYAVCRHLKEVPETSEIPVVFVTAKNEEADEMKGFESGAVDFIRKPVNASITRFRVNTHLELKKHRDHLKTQLDRRTFEVSDSREKLERERDNLSRLEGLLKTREEDALIQQVYFSELFNNSPQAIVLVDTGGCIIDSNTGFENLFGYDCEEIRGLLCEKLIVPEDLTTEHGKICDLVAGGETVSLETLRKHSDGSFKEVSMIGYPVEIKDEIKGLFYIYEDITQRKEFEKQLRHQAFHDPLTGIPNRALLLERLGRALERSRRRDDFMFSVLLMDLDRFKWVNDSMGHEAGDILLKSITERVRACVRSADTVARLGGDEFAVLLEDIKSRDDVIAVSDRIRDAAEIPVKIKGSEVQVSASIGVVIDTKKYGSPDEIIRDADLAMYHAKDRGKARWKVFTEKMHRQAVESLKLESELRKALQRCQLQLYYQPIICISSNQLKGFEALLRWNHPAYGFIPPDKFIPIAEETGLIMPIGQWVLEEACRQLKKWNETLPSSRTLSMSVNMSAKQFLQQDLVDNVVTVLKENGIRPECLKIELTESVLMEHTETAVEKLDRLRKLGVKLVIDDFGTGYSSLSYIHRFAVDNLKIDRSFIRDLGKVQETTEIVQTILSLSRSLGLTVVAEGVEDTRQLEMLRDLSCENAQGYLFSKPVDREEAGKIITQFF